MLGSDDDASREVSCLGNDVLALVPEAISHANGNVL
jgi:hypothetical protein